MRGPIDIKGSDRSGTSVMIPILCHISMIFIIIECTDVLMSQVREMIAAMGIYVLVWIFTKVN